MSPEPLGASVAGGQTRFAVRAPLATQLWLCLFDAPENDAPETNRPDTNRPDTSRPDANRAEWRLPMDRDENGIWRLTIPRDLAGAHYGYRADGPWAPEHGQWFDPAKLLVDPYALELDRRFIQHPSLAEHGTDTAALVPRAIVPPPLAQAPREPPRFTPGGLIYELNVRGFTLLHPAVPEAQRGTIAALAHPAIIAHLKKLRVDAVELMPIVAWIDERHLPPLRLVNAWGYNPVAPMALDPGLCPGGVAELRETVAALHAAGIGVILDIVLNHTGESDILGPTLCLRGLDNAAYAHAPEGQSHYGSLINDTGCGNTLDFGNPAVRALALATLRHFVAHAGIDGFRFDLAPVLARGSSWGGGFRPDAPIFAELAADPLLADRIMIAEPWDIGPGGYQLGRFPPNWLEWNDRFRDDARRFWRGDEAIGTLATRLAGSADIFGEQDCRSINFLAAHDGFTLADTVAYAQRHNQANGEDNRDGHGENFSWNCGVEGPTDDPAILAARAADLRALLATLFASTGTLLLTAGDEFGRSQQGNNNAYCQDSAIGWVNWTERDAALEDYVATLAARRAEMGGAAAFAQFPTAGAWARGDGAMMDVADWEDPANGALAYRSLDPARPRAFFIDRAARRAHLGPAQP